MIAAFPSFMPKLTTSITLHFDYNLKNEVLLWKRIKTDDDRDLKRVRKGREN